MNKLKEIILQVLDDNTYYTYYDEDYDISFKDSYNKNKDQVLENITNQILVNMKKVFIVNCVAEKDTWVQKVFADPVDAQKYALRLADIAKELKNRCPEWTEGGNNDDYYFHWQRWHFWMLLKDVYVIDFDIN